MALVLFGCDPDATNLGVDLDAVEGADGWTIEWRVDGELDSVFLDVATTPDDGAIVLESHRGRSLTRVRRFAADGTETIMLTDTFAVGGAIAVSDSAVFVARDRSVSGAGGLRASVRRLLDEGDVDSEYVHPRTADANTFAMGVAASANEVALVIGNWGGLQPGESWFEVLRLDHELQPIDEAIPFDHRVVQVGYDGSGDLVILEAFEDGPSLLHRPITGEDPIEVDCGSLLVEGGAPLCASVHPPLTITNYETGEVETLVELDLDAYAPSARTLSTVFASSTGPAAPLRVVEVLDGGAIGRNAQVPIAGAAQGVIPVGLGQTQDGAVYAIAMEALNGESCPGGEWTCLRSYLVRLAAAE